MTDMMGRHFTDPDDDNIVWEVNPGDEVFDGMWQAELVAGPEDRLGEMDLFDGATIEVNKLWKRKFHSNGVVELRPDNPKATVCGTCKRGWDDTVSTAWTPAPSGRCPFEYEHPEPIPTRNTSDMWLIYVDTNGDQHCQHWRDLVDVGTLIDPETGDDMDIIGWITER
jgi:hypothetical protein